MHSIFLYILCQAVMQALSFLYIWERVVLWEVSVWERARLVSGVGLVTVILLYIVRAHSSTLSRPIYRAARDTSHRFYYSLSYSSQASSRMQERARMLLICAVVALYSGFASCRPEDYPFRNWTLPWEERVMVSYNCVL